jgi:putative DeoR family transcriptional regulator (stage III sporulation protein D)
MYIIKKIYIKLNGETMNEAIRMRVIYQARVMLENQLTVREVAKIIGLSKSTIHKDLTEKLKIIDENLYDEIMQLLEHNKNIRHIRGGQKTKEKYEYLKSIHLLHQ